MQYVTITCTCEVCCVSTRVDMSFADIYKRSCSNVFQDMGFNRIQSSGRWACAACMKKYEDLIETQKLQLKNFGKGEIKNG